MVRSMIRYSRVLLFVVAALLPGTADAFTVRGRVINGTTEQGVHPAKITVVRPSGGMMIDREVETLDEEGRFKVDGLDESAPVYLLRVNYDGVNYTEMVQFHGHDDVKVEIFVYEMTPTWEDIRVSLPHVMLERVGDTLRVDKFYQITNATSPAKTVTGDDARFVFQLPDDFIEINSAEVMSLGIPLPMSPTPTDEPGFYAIDHPIKPGTTRVSVSYNVPYAGSRYDYREDLKYDIDEMLIISEDPEITVASETTTVERVDDFHGFQAFRLANITKDEPLVFTVTGGNPLARVMPTVITVPNSTQPIAVALMVFLPLVLIAFMGMTAGRAQSGRIPVEALAAERDSLLDQIARLDDLHATGTVSDYLYRLQRTELTSKLARIYYEMKLEHAGQGPPALGDQKGAARV